MNYEKTGYLTTPFKMFHLIDSQKLNIDFHYHDFHKILIHLSGDVSYSIEGRSYRLYPNDIVIVNAGEVHRPILNNDSTYERIIIYISKEFLNEYSTNQTDLAHCFKQALVKQSHVLRFASIKGSPLDNAIKGIDAAIADNDYANELYRKLRFLEFMIQLNRATLKGGIEYINTFTSNKKIIEIIDYLNDNLTKPLDINYLSERFFISRYYLMHTFKEETGYTIGQYISTKRLLLARDMITKGSNVHEACYSCGFNSYSAFIRAYKKCFGETPTSHLSH